MSMTRIVWMAVIFALVAPAAEAGGGKAIFDKACATCHFAQRDPARRDDMVAPPIDMMSARIRQLTGNSREAFVARVLDYIKAPAAEKSADPMAVQRFGLMPAIGDTFPDLSDGELKSVAEWMFDAHAAVRLPAQPGMGFGRQ